MALYYFFRRLVIANQGFDSAQPDTIVTLSGAEGIVTLSGVEGIVTLSEAEGIVTLIGVEGCSTTLYSPSSSSSPA